MSMKRMIVAALLFVIPTLSAAEPAGAPNNLKVLQDIDLRLKTISSQLETLNRQTQTMHNHGQVILIQYENLGAGDRAAVCQQIGATYIGEAGREVGANVTTVPRTMFACRM
jgi:hypothetical protein